jgi:hypothetical protein
MPVNIRENKRYREVASSLMRKNMSGEKHITGIFSTLAKWRKPMPEDDKIVLHQIFANAMKVREGNVKPSPADVVWLKKQWKAIMYEMSSTMRPKI